MGRGGGAFVAKATHGVECRSLNSIRMMLTLHLQGVVKMKVK